VWVRIVTSQLEVFELVVVDRYRLTLELEGRESTRLARELCLNLFHVTGVDMGIAQGDDNLTNVQITLCKHMGQASQRGRVVGQPNPFLYRRLLQDHDSVSLNIRSYALKYPQAVGSAMKLYSIPPIPSRDFAAPHQGDKSRTPIFKEWGVV